MLKRTIRSTPDGNFNSLGGVSVHSVDLSAYREYRRCWKEYPEKFILRDFPMHLDIEITNRCNLRCVFCDRQPFIDKNHIGDMELGLFKKIIDECRKYKLWAIKLSYRGEPLLHKELFKMISYAKQNGIIDTYFNTNGTLLNENKINRIINSGLDRISISIEGTDKGDYERLRIGSDFEVVLRNVSDLYRIRRQRKVAHPKIRIQSVALPGLDTLRYRNFWLNYCDEVAVLDYTDMSSRRRGIVYDWACPQLWQRMTIEWDGSIFACNNNDLRGLQIGNINERFIYDCWHDPKLEYVRVLHKEGRAHDVNDCNGCPWRTAQIEKLKKSQDDKG